MGSRVGQVVNRLKLTFACTSGKTHRTPQRYVLFFLVFVPLLYTYLYKAVVS